jgi:hypothetical protein
MWLATSSARIDSAHGNASSHRQRHRRDAAGDTAARAFVAQDRKHIVVVRVLRRDRLVRLAVLHGERNAGHDEGGDENEADVLGDDRHGCCCGKAD